MKGTDAQIKELIRGYLQKWKVEIGLGYWDLSICWTEKKHVASVVGLPAYMEATFYFNLKRIKEELDSPEELEKMVLHEMAHPILWELANRRGPPSNKQAAKDGGIDKLEENTTTFFQRAVWNAYQLGLEEGKQSGRKK